MALDFVVENKPPVVFKHHHPSNKKEKRKIQTEFMTAAIEEGLTKSIDQKNKGYQLLSKFGYSHGVGLGKDNKGIKEPITLQKNDLRAGLGIQGQLNIKKLKTEEQKGEMEIKFLNSMRQSRLTKHLLRDIIQAEKCIFELDDQHGIESNDLWPKESETTISSYELQEHNPAYNSDSDPQESAEKLSDQSDATRLKRCIEVMYSTVICPPMYLSHYYTLFCCTTLVFESKVFILHLLWLCIHR